MALLATVTKKSVTTSQAKLWSITFNLKVLDGAAEVINQDFSCEYRQGDVPSSKVNEIKEKMQAVIDNYKSSKAIFDNALLDTATSAIQSGVTL
jgi:hypothetical protein